MSGKNEKNCEKLLLSPDIPTRQGEEMELVLAGTKFPDTMT